MWGSPVEYFFDPLGGVPRTLETPIHLSPAFFGGLLQDSTYPFFLFAGWLLLPTLRCDIGARDLQHRFIDEIESEKERSDAFQYESKDQFLNVATSNDHQPRLGLAIADEEETCAVAVAQEIERLLDNGTVKDPN